MSFLTNIIPYFNRYAVAVVVAAVVVEIDTSYLPVGGSLQEWPSSKGVASEKSS